MPEHELSPGTLHFYPGQGVLAFVVHGKLFKWAEAWGGPAEEQPKDPDEPFPMGPTNPGRYIIWKIAPYVTHTWALSRIRWGSRLKLSHRDPNDVLYETPSGRWESVRRKTGWTRSRIADWYLGHYGKREIPKEWVLNDFGKKAIRYFKDRNHDGILDGDEHLEGEMFHATAENEAENATKQKLKMFYSHGCIHLRPLQRDAMIDAGVFARGRVLIIHEYNEKFVPKPGDPTSELSKF
jgi:hypothetical protein